MTERPFDDIQADVLALCGIPDANTQEVARIARFINMRARKAYQSAEIWPRFYKIGEERIVSEDGLLPYEQDGLDTIGTCLRVHATEPFGTCGAPEYPNLVSASGGIQIAGYSPRELSAGADMIVTGTLNPDVAGRYTVIGTVPAGEVTPEAPIYRSVSNTNYQIYPFFVLPSGYYLWRLGDLNSIDYWQPDLPDSSPDWTTPDLVNGFWVANGSATGDPTVTADVLYSAYVTYKAAFNTTYASGDEVPEEWAEYIIHGSAADWLKSEGRPEEAYPMLAEARDFLDDQLCRISINGSDTHTRVLTHSNTQAR